MNPKMLIRIDIAIEQPPSYGNGIRLSESAQVSASSFSDAAKILQQFDNLVKEMQSQNGVTKNG